MAILADSSEKKRLWFVCARLGVASEVWMYRQAVGLRKFDVCVVTEEHLDADQFPFDASSISTIPNFGKLPRRGPKRYAAMLRNFRVGFIPMPRAEARWWERQIRQAPPDVVYCQYGYTGTRVAPFACREGIPTVIQFNGVDASAMLRHRGYQMRLRAVLPKLAGCVIVAEYQRQRLETLGARPERIRLIPYGVPTDQFVAGGRDAESRCRFLSVGRLVGKKAPDLTLRAFARCAAEVPDCELVMVGDGPLRETCETLARELGVAQRVSFLGAQPIERVRQEMAAASVFVQHSVTGPDGDMEGWPVSVGEACASGLPIVSTRHAGIVDQVREGETGFLVDERDWEAMARQMAKLAGDARLRHRMGQASRAHIERFDTRDQIAQLESFLLECSTTGTR